MIEKVQEFTVGGLGRQLIPGDLKEKSGIPVIVTVVDCGADTAREVPKWSATVG